MGKIYAAPEGYEDSPTEVPKKRLSLDQQSILSSKSQHSDIDHLIPQLAGNDRQTHKASDTPCMKMATCNNNTVVFPNTPHNGRNEKSFFEVQTSELDVQRHLAMTGECFRSLYKCDHLTDVTIKIDDDQYSAHRAVLIAHSQLLRDNLIDKDPQEPVELNMAGLPTEAFKIILDYLYSGEISITLENIADLHCAGQQLSIKNLLQSCEMKLQEMDAHDALIILHTAFNKDSDICSRAFRIVVQAFQDIMDSPELMVQHISMFLRIIASDRLVVEKEMDVFRAAMAWIKYERNRLEYVNKVLGQVRFCYMSTRELMISSEIMKGIRTDLTRYMLDSMWFAVARQLGCKSKMSITLYPKRQYQAYAPVPARATGRENDCSMTVAGFMDIGLETGGRQHLEWKTTKKRITASDMKSIDEKAIIVVGGLNGPNGPNDPDERGKSIFAYTPHNETWRKVGELPEGRHLHGVAFLMDSLFVVGGSTPTEADDPVPSPTCSVWKWDLKKNEWIECTMMTNRRMLHSVATLNTRIYAIGGQAECTRMLKSVEVYNPTLNRWDDVAPLTTGRMGMGVTSHRGKIMIVGGYSDICTNTSGVPVMSAVELYELATDSWTVLQDLPSPRFHSALVEFDGQTYMCGGATRHDDEETEVVGMLSVASIEKYNPDMDTWKQVAALNYPRHGAAVAVIGSKMFIMGGVSTMEQGSVDKVESLDMITGLRHCSDLGCPAQMGMGATVCDAGLMEGEQFSRYDKRPTSDDEREAVEVADKIAEKQMSIKF